MRTRLELADVVRRFAPSLQDRGTLTPLQEKVFAKIALVEPPLLADTRRRVTTAARFVIAITVVATGIVQNARQPDKPSGLTGWCKAHSP